MLHHRTTDPAERASDIASRTPCVDYYGYDIHAEYRLFQEIHREFGTAIDDVNAVETICDRRKAGHPDRIGCRIERHIRYHTRKALNEEPTWPDEPNRKPIRKRRRTRKSTESFTLRIFAP
jgi:hypothetical protein